MSEVASQATPDRLTALLRHAGALGSGAVVEVGVESTRDTLISRITRLRLTYDRQQDAGPSHVFFKTSHERVSATLRELGRKEAAFYDVVASSVRGYAFDVLWEDYRLSVLWQIATPMWQANHGIGAWVWWNHLECVMAAVHDLGCLELLD